MYKMAKRYAHILLPEMREAVAVLGAKAPVNRPETGYSPPNVVAVPGLLRPRYDREELYEKVWKVPLRTLAKEYGVSDIALAKTCRKLNVPVPGRGYWAKREALLLVPPRPPLPPLNEHGGVAALERGITHGASPADGKKKPVKSEKPASRKERAPRRRKAA